MIALELFRTLRVLARAPRFTLVAIATLSVSIALALAVIRLATALLWQSPPGIEAVEQLARSSPPMQPAA